MDVLQALFYFLLRIGALPAYPSGTPSTPVERPPIATLLKPFDSLTLLISAIGHDVGHPGVNNAFLVALNAPLAQLYNDRSVLESFHCAAYSQILRRYWPDAFADVAMRKLMINSILATDMGLHFKYMADLGNLQEKLAHNNGGIDGWSPKVLEEYRDLICGLLIKCADISNVVCLPAIISCPRISPCQISCRALLSTITNAVTNRREISKLRCSGRAFSRTSSAIKAKWSRSFHYQRAFLAGLPSEMTPSNWESHRLAS